MNLCFSIFRLNYCVSALFELLTAAKIEQILWKLLHKVLGARLLVFTNQRFGALFHFQEKGMVFKEPLNK